MSHSPTYYAIIPAHVRYAKIKPHAKLLYGEITALSNKEGYCFASNKYFADLYSVTKNTISLWIKELETNKFITNTIIKKDNQIVQRRIATIIPSGTPIINNDGYNIINNNTTNNNILIREQKFSNDISLLGFPIPMQKEFFDYWRETNKSKTKMRWELEKTWNLKARLQRWERMNSRFKTNNKSKIQKTLDAHAKAKEMINKINNNVN
tara:strand:- start:3640 stop:4266 length:627 start_codon:yes stop_codon:yes gene_type:complete